jgi:hypothetical protein
MEPQHERIARIALGAGARYGLALAIGPVLHADDAVANKVCALFADALGALTQITDAAFAEYRTDPGMIADMRHRFAQWRRELLEAERR